MIGQTRPCRVRFGFKKLCINLSILLILLMPACLFWSCSAPQVTKSPAKGVYHVVKKGETAYSIARAYSINLKDLAEINNISDVSNLKEGSVIFIPDASQVIDDVMARSGLTGTELKTETPEISKDSEQSVPDQTAGKSRESGKTPSARPASGETAGVAPPPQTEKPVAEKQQEDVKLEKGNFIWPVKGVVKTRFGTQPNKTYHSWITIACSDKSKVKAAASGIVIYSASLPSFGETIIVRHPDSYTTVYTHLKTRTVKADQNVKRGEIIALAGVKDKTGDTYINFEIRHKGNKPLNPLFYLP